MTTRTRLLDPMRDDPAESDLIHRAREGQPGAFDDLVRLHFSRIYRVLFRLAGNHEDAEDLAQECFIRAHANLRRYRADAPFSAWLYRIALHLARDHHRASLRRAKGMDPASPVFERPGKLAGPQEESVGRELGRDLSAALQRLSHRMRVIFVLRVFEGLEYSEVARIAGVTAGTARIYVMKARRELSRSMAAWLDERSRA